MLPFGSQFPNCKGLGASCTSSRLLRSRGWWPQCGMVTPSSLLRTRAATLLAHCALQWAAQCLKWMSTSFIMLFSVWRGKHGQQLTPAHYSWRSNASHSSSGASRSLGYFAKHKRNRVTESWCPCERHWLTGHHQAGIRRSKNAELHPWLGMARLSYSLASPFQARTKRCVFSVQHDKIKGI